MFKKILVVFALVLVVQYWGEIKNLIYPPPDFAAGHEGKVILYATSWCGYCAKTRRLLQENNIDYFEYDIEKSVEGRRQYKSLGGKIISVLLIKGKVVEGYNPNLIMELAKST